MVDEPEKPRPSGWPHRRQNAALRGLVWVHLGFRQRTTLGPSAAQLVREVTKRPAIIATSMRIKDPKSRRNTPSIDNTNATAAIAVTRARTTNMDSALTMRHAVTEVGLVERLSPQKMQ